MIGKLEDEHKKQLPKHLVKLTHAYNLTRSAVTGYSPHFLMFGWRPRLPIDFLFPTHEVMGKMGVVMVSMVSSDELATLEVNYYVWTSCSHGQRQWALDFSELLSNYNLHHQQALTDCLFVFIMFEDEHYFSRKGGEWTYSPCCTINQNFGFYDQIGQMGPYLLRVVTQPTSWMSHSTDS